MKKKQEIPIRPALTLPEKIQIISNSSMPNKDKIDCILVLWEGEIMEKNICLNREKIRQQLMSEILYLIANEESKKKIGKGYIYKRINLGWRNCVKNGWVIPTGQKEQGCDFLENLQEKQLVMIKEEKGKKKKRNTGWHRSTWARYERFYLGRDDVSTKKKRQPQRQRLLPLSGLTPRNKEVE